MHWKAAAERDPRNASYWQALAEGYLADHNYADAAKAWRNGEQAATDPAERETHAPGAHARRAAAPGLREAEKRQEPRRRRARSHKLKAQARAELHKAEAKFSDGTPARRRQGRAVVGRPQARRHKSAAP